MVSISLRRSSHVKGLAVTKFLPTPTIAPLLILYHSHETKQQKFFKHYTPDCRWLPSVMNDSQAQARAKSLACEARSKLASNDQNGALTAAKEALQLDPHIQDAIDVLQQLHITPSSSSVVQTCQTFTASWSVADQEAFSKQLQQHGSSLPLDQADKCLGLLLSHHTPEDSKAESLLDTSFKALLLSSPAARKALAKRCTSNMTVVYNRVWDIGEKSVNALLSVVLDKSCWIADQDRNEAITGTFQLDLARVIGAGEDHLTWAIDSIVLIARAAPEQIKYLADADAFSILLECLDMRRALGLRRGALTAVKLLLDVTVIDGEKHLQTFVAAKVKRGTNDDLIHAFSAASAIFPILPVPAAQLFLTEGFLQNLMPRLAQNTYEASERRSTRLEHSALELLSAVCQDKACRTHVAKYSTTWLQDVAESSSDPESAALAALVLAKTYQVQLEGVTQLPCRDGEHLASILGNMLLNAEHDVELRSIVEGLSYVSMEPKVKQSVADNDRLLQKLVSVLQEHGDDKPLALGVLITFLSLVQHKPRQTEEQRRVGELKAYAEASKPVDDDPLLEDSHVHSRCKKLREAKAIPVILSRVKGATENILTTIVKIVFNISQDPASHGQLAQQGAIKALLQIGTAQAAGQDLEGIQLMAAHTLARILTSINPEHTFTSTLPATSALKPLGSLLSLTGDLLPVHDSLRALTNLASMPDGSAREGIARTLMSEVEELMLSSNARIQQAATELLCNLVVSPQLVKMYSDGSGPARHRLTVLLALTDAAHMPTRRAAAGALAMLTQYEETAKAVLDKEGGVKRVLGLCATGEGDEMLHRGLVVLGNLLSVPGGKENINAEGGAEKVKLALRSTRDGDVLAVGVEVLKMLV